MWDVRDAWILQSIVYAAGRGSGQLPEVMAAADHINVDIPTLEDLERSVNRLAAAGLVSSEGTTFRASRTARRMVRKVGSWRAGIRTLPPLIETELQTIPFPDHVPIWTLTNEAWQNAYDAYYPPEERTSA